MTVASPRTVATEPREVTFRRDDVKLHALDWGGPADATPMILLHGCGGNAWTWGALAPLLRLALGDAYHIVGLDQRGAGDSDKPETGYESIDFGLDVLAVQDAMGGKPMVVVGHSRGGWTAAYVAGKWPERVSQAVLVDPARVTFASSEDADDFYGAVLAGLGPFPSKEAAIALSMQREPRQKWTPERERSFLGGLSEQPDGSLVGKMTPQVVEQLRRAREDSDSVGPLLASVRAPVLLLVSSFSNLWRQNQKLEYSRRIPQARVHFLEGTHALQLDLPWPVAELIINFLRSTDSRA
jgi:pimeloyl-ACP methyl ester carboxylesterase